MTSVFPGDRKEDIQRETQGKARPGILPLGDRAAWSTPPPRLGAGLGGGVLPPRLGAGHGDAPLEPLEVGRAAHMSISDF